MTTKTLEVHVITPLGVVYEHHATMVIARTPDGELGILPRHAPIIAPLAIDEVRVNRSDSKEHVDWIAVNGGVFEGRDDVVIILADSAERDRDIDVDRAEAAFQKASKIVDENTSETDVKLAKAKLSRAMVSKGVAKYRIDL